MEAEDDGVGEAGAALEEDFRDAGGADVDAGGEIAGDGADEELGEVGNGFVAASRVPMVPACKVEGVLEDGEIGLQADLFGGLLVGLFFGVVVSRR